MRSVAKFKLKVVNSPTIGSHRRIRSHPSSSIGSHGKLILKLGPFSYHHKMWRHENVREEANTKPEPGWSAFADIACQHLTYEGSKYNLHKSNIDREGLIDAREGNVKIVEYKL